MTFVRVVFVSLAVLLPTVWTAARAADEPPAGDTSGEKSAKKSKKKSKKGEGDKGGGDKKAEEPPK
jgi:hypothetical protein